MQLNKVALGLSAGILWGVCILVATLWVVVRGGGEHLRLFEQFYFGYSVSPVGAAVGLVWGFADGFVCGWVFGWLYNRFAGRKAGG